MTRVVACVMVVCVAGACQAPPTPPAAPVVNNEATPVRGDNAFLSTPDDVAARAPRMRAIHGRLWWKPEGECYLSIKLDEVPSVTGFVTVPDEWCDSLRYQR